MGGLILSKVNRLINIELDELWEWDIEINNLNPILEPLTIITNIINKEGREIDNKLEDREKYNEISISSRLNSIIIMFFRHQHILIILSDSINMIIEIWEFSTSKVDILFKLLRTYGNIDVFIWNFVCN